MAVSDNGALARDLGRQVDGEVRFDPGTRATYSTDASNFRQVPLGVVLPRTVDAGAQAVAVCRDHEAPLLSRGGGTSLAGQCTNTAVILDWTKYCDRLVSVDVAARRCIVEPGIVLDELNRRLAPTGLCYGPKPATHPNCTIGGMIGNNSCGSTAQRTGKVVDNVSRLEVLCYDGTRFWCGPTSEHEYEEIVSDPGRRAEIYRGLRHLVDEYGSDIREHYPDIPRRVSGYNLDSLLGEQGFDVAKALVGSESTLVTVLHAELELVPVVKYRVLVALGFPDVANAADAVPAVVDHRPIALEGLDDRFVRGQKQKGLQLPALDDLPEGSGWLLVQFGGDDLKEADDRATGLLDAMGRTAEDPNVRVYDDPEKEDELWRIREAGLGATAHIPGDRETWEGWEDSAVPPERLGDYLRDLEALYEEFGYADDLMPSRYGHFGQGCVHTRIPFDLSSDDGVARYRHFLERAARLVAGYGGSLSGEHGDGQSRGALLGVMFGDRVVSAFEATKRLFDPTNKMNPGKVVFPAPPDAHLRLGSTWDPIDPGPLYFGYSDDGGSFRAAANRCVGVGKCRQHSTSSGAVMCPSYQVTREEVHSTRGRARLLFEMLDGHHDGPIERAWRSEPVRAALDLCLACKGCKSDCPVNVDMATYKAEFLAHYWKGRLRPRHHYALGWLPLAGLVVSRLRAGPLANLMSHTPPLDRAVTALAGIEQREVPLFAPRTLQQWAEHRSRGRTAPSGRGDVIVWPDTFTNVFHPHVGEAAIQVIESAGWRAHVPQDPLCCGLTWVSTGQLAMARRVLRRSLAKVAGHLGRGGLVVGLEPSCTAMLRSDAPELLPGDPLVERLQRQTVTFAELLTAHSDGWSPPTLAPSEAIVQVHCHQHAVLGWDADRDLLDSAGVEARRLNSGCCGLAGNFGFEPGHRDVSEACAERVLLPAVRSASPETVILADGFSCRTQIHQLDSGGREAVHLAELLAAGSSPHAQGTALDPGDRHPETILGPRPSTVHRNGRARDRSLL